jgi:hypothetical protein
MSFHVESVVDDEKESTRLEDVDHVTGAALDIQNCEASVRPSNDHNKLLSLIMGRKRLMMTIQECLDSQFGYHNYNSLATCCMISKGQSDRCRITVAHRMHRGHTGDR